VNGLRSRTIVLQSKSEAKGYHHSERVFNENNSLVKKIEMGWNEQSSMSRGSIGLSRKVGTGSMDYQWIWLRLALSLLIMMDQIQELQLVIIETTSHRCDEYRLATERLIWALDGKTGSGEEETGDENKELI
jgi:hypothetical protein